MRHRHNPQLPEKRENRMTNVLQHITLTTGQIAQLPRGAVADDDIAACAELLDGVLLGGVLPLPDVTGFLVDGSHYRDDLKVTLWAGTPLRRLPVLTIGVARGPTSGVALWREMHRSARVPLGTDATSPPPEPWVVDRPEPGAPRHPESAEWTERWLACVGWTWMEYGRSPPIHRS